MRSKNKFQDNRIFVLNDPNSPRLSPKLAEEIGLNESILLLQIEFWISIGNNFKEGKKWTYQSIRDIKDFFPFWSVGTIHGIIKSLKLQKLIIVKTFNVRKNDKTQWFTLNFESINNLQSLTVPGLKDGVQEMNDVFKNQTSYSGTEQGCSEIEQTLFNNRTTLPEREITENTEKKINGVCVINNSPESTSQLIHPEEMKINDSGKVKFNLTKEGFKEKIWLIYPRQIGFDEGYLKAKEIIKSDEDALNVIKAIRKYKYSYEADRGILMKFSNFLNCYKDFLEFNKY